MPPKTTHLMLVLILCLALAGLFSACNDESTSPVATTTGGEEVDPGPGDKSPCEGESCGKCQGEVTTLTLRYNGVVNGASIEIIQHCPFVTIFFNVVQPGGQIFIVGNDSNMTMGQQVDVYVNGDLNASFHVSCSEPIGPGLIDGDFEILAGTSKAGGRLCSMDCQLTWSW